MYLYLLNIGISPPARIIGALSFAFSGFMMTKLEWSTGGQAGMWLPLLLLLIDKIIKNPSFLKVFFGSLVLAIINLAGHFQVPVYVLGFCFIYSFFRIINLKDKKNLKTKVLFLLLILVFGIGIAACQLLPSFELYKFSIRESEGYIKDYNFGLLPFRHLFTFLAPDFYGHPATMNYWGFWNYHEMAGYFGLIPLIFALGAAFLRRDRQTTFFLVFSLVVLSFILPTPWAKIPYIFSLPAIGTSAATRLFFLFGFLVSTLAALGADGIFRNWQKIKIKFLKQIGFVLLIFLGITIGVLISLLIYKKALFFEGSEIVFSQFITQQKNQAVVSLRNLILPWGLLLSFSFLLALGFLKKESKIIFCFFWGGVIFLTAFDLFRFGWKYNPFVKKDFLFPSTPVMEYLQKQEKPFRVLFEDRIVPSNMWIPYRLESPVGYDPIYPQRTAEFLMFINGGNFKNPTGRYADIKRFDSPLVDLINTKYILALKYDESGHISPQGKRLLKFQLPKLKLVFEDKSVQILENTAVLPRAFIVYDHKVETDQGKILEALLEPEFDLRKKIVLEEPIPQALKEGQVNQVTYNQKINGESEVSINHSGDGLLFVSDSYYLGWEAFVDGRQTKIYRANYNFRAVIVPAGEHQVVFKYKPQSFKIGLYLSGGTLLVILAGGIIFWKRKKI
jgi:uncharacterized membrane protein YfhO